MSSCSRLSATASRDGDARLQSAVVKAMKGLQNWDRTDCNWYWLDGRTCHERPDQKPS